MPLQIFRVRQLGRDIRRHRKAHRLSTRAAAKWVGISPATFCRAEDGRETSVENFFLLCHWLQADPADYCGLTGKPLKDLPTEPLPAQVEEMNEEGHFSKISNEEDAAQKRRTGSTKRKKPMSQSEVNIDILGASVSASIRFAIDPGRSEPVSKDELKRRIEYMRKCLGTISKNADKFDTEEGFLRYLKGL